MKVCIAAIGAALLIVGGCSEPADQALQRDAQIRGLERRIDALERDDDRLRAEIQALRSFENQIIKKHNGLNDLVAKHRSEHLDAADRQQAR